MNTLEPFIVNQTSTTTLEAESKQLNQHDISDRQDSYTSFYSCHSGSELAQENTILLQGDEIKPSESSSNKSSCIINGDRREMNAKNSNHHPRHVVVDSNHIHHKISTMPIDRSKYIYHDGRPIDYILVYTRYHSNHFRRSHKLIRQHDQYRQFFQDRLRKLGFIVVEERLTDEENDLLNLRQAEGSQDVYDANSNDESNHVLVRSLSTLQRHVSVHLQHISSHLRRETHDVSNTLGRPRDTIREEEMTELNNSTHIVKHEYYPKKKSQLKFENDDAIKQDERYFVKIHAPFEVLLVLAEKLKVKLPFSENKAPLKPGLFDQGLPCQSTRLNPCEFPKPHKGKSFFTACYQKSLHYRFFKHFDDVDQVFRQAERSRLVYETLLRCPYRSSDPIQIGLHDTNIQPSKLDSCLSNRCMNIKRQETHTSEEQTLNIEEVFTSSTRQSGMKDTGIEVLLEEGVYEAAYPLHDQLIHEEDAGEPETWNARMKLYHRWAKFSNIFRIQPIRAIRDYYGERLAFYFAWLGWYNSLLIIPSILGIFVLLWGLCSVKYDIPTLDTCNSTSSYLMCPKIDRRTYWFLNETCFNAKMSYVFDNSAAVAFSIMISIFAVSINFLWQRHEFRLQYEWDMTDISEETETLRPDFERRVHKTIVNEVTDKIEPYVPAYKRILYYTSSFSIVLLMVLLVLAVVAGIVVYRLSVSAAFNSIDREMWVYRWKPIIVPITGALINLIIILILQYFYEILAIWLTNVELHRTDKSYEASLTIKMFLFQFVNYYASIFYIALIKPLIIYKPTYLDRYSRAFRLEECDVSGCVWELSIQLMIIMVGKQLISNIWEFYFSKLWNMCRKRIRFRDTVRQINERNAKVKKMHEQVLAINLRRSYEEDFLLQPFELTTLFYEYLEIILQFGFVTFFCLSFPLAPLFAFLNNIFEIRIDALKVVKEFRRPVARRAVGIGTWNSILTIMAKITVLSNAFLIAITSEYIPRQVYYWTIGNRSLNGFVDHTLAPFHPSDFPSIINRTLLECQFIESRLIDLFKQSTFFIPFAQSYHLSSFDCNSTLANEIRSQIDFSTCYYKDYRLDHSRNYGRSYMFYYVMVARLAFVIIFEHFVYCILFLVRNLISRVPRSVRAQLDRCRYLVQQMYWGAELYAQNPNLIRKDENRVHTDEQNHEFNRHSTLPSLMITPNELTFNPCVTPDL
ncbi:unnamed protein product [Rotaria magnacalcarata]|uniref:Anoctamin n=1 Tax=Rotaria magnacalcarata TaxID=392030 RepID=A0A816SQJ8_9BILA|nr:unnamed protein product [Rotaria magnacalcarata]